MTVEKVLNTIDILENINTLDEYAYETAFRAFLSIGGLPALVHGFNGKIDVFRTRTHDEDVYFTNFSDIVNPPNHLVKNFARCNRPYQSKFYGSENRQTSYMELVYSWSQNKEPGDTLYTTIGKWLLSSPLNALIITHPDPEARVSDFDKTHGEGYDLVMAQFDGEIRQACEILYSYLHEKFRKVAYNEPLVYLITSAYTNATLSTKEAHIDAICYPSVPFMEQGINFAVNSSYLQNANMELTAAMRNQFIVSLNDEGKHVFTETEAVMAKSIEQEARQINW